MSKNKEDWNNKCDLLKTVHKTTVFIYLRERERMWEEQREKRRERQSLKQTPC